MKQQIELTCASCGEKFTAEVDYLIEGISGVLVNAQGEQVIFVDPTAEHHCTCCVIKAIAAASERR